MPIVGEVDVSAILAKLGDPNHGLRPAAPLVPQEDGEDIFRAAMGTVDMSTVQRLSRPYTVVWDVNGYYRALSITWPYKPSKRQLREGYQTVEGQASDRLTYYLKQLLDPEVRAAYDATPLGKVFRDKYVVEKDLHALSKVASDESAKTGEVVTISDIERKYGKGDKPKLPPARRSIGWNWGYYVLKSRKDDDQALADWQRFLVSAFGQRGLEVVVSIGYIGNTRKDFDIRRHDGRTVFFLNQETEPTPELAEIAVSKFMLTDER